MEKTKGQFERTLFLLLTRHIEKQDKIDSGSNEALSLNLQWYIDNGNFVGGQTSDSLVIINALVL